MYKYFFIVLILIFIGVNVHADEAMDELAKELGIPKEITVTKRALALIAWSATEKGINVQTADESCKLTRNIHKRNNESTGERRKRLNALKVNPEIPLHKCEAVFSELNQECLNIAREFYVEHYIADTVSQPMVVKTLVFLVRMCPTTKMLGYEVDASKIYKNHSKLHK